MADFSNGQLTIPTGGSNVPQKIGIPSAGAGGSLMFKAKKLNAATMYFGTNSPSQLTPTTGYPLEPGDQSNEIDSASGNVLYVIGSAGDTVAWILVAP